MADLGPHPAFLASHFASAGAASTTAHSDLLGLSIISDANASGLLPAMAEADILESTPSWTRIEGRNRLKTVAPSKKRR
jgi:hypothetical protein